MGRSISFFEGKITEYAEWPGVDPLPVGAIAYESGDTTSMPWIRITHPKGNLKKSFVPLDEHQVPKECLAFVLLLT